MATFKEGITAGTRWKRMTANHGDSCGVKRLGGNRGVQHLGCDANIAIGDTFYWDKSNYVAYCDACGQDKFECGKGNLFAPPSTLPRAAAPTTAPQTPTFASEIPTREAAAPVRVEVPTVKVVYALPLTDTRQCYCAMLDRREQCGYCLALATMQQEGDLA